MCSLNLNDLLLLYLCPPGYYALTIAFSFPVHLPSASLSHDKSRDQGMMPLNYDLNLQYN